VLTHKAVFVINGSAYINNHSNIILTGKQSNQILAYQKTPTRHALTVKTELLDCVVVFYGQVLMQKILLGEASDSKIV